jgi:ribokinase
LLCNEVPLHVVREALTCAQAAGATTILNPAPATGIDRSIFALADIITPNRNELSMLLATEARRTGRRNDPTQEAPSRARLLLEPGPEGPGVRKAVIVTLGAAGVMVLERNDAEPADVTQTGRDFEGVRIWEVPAERVSTIDSTGAGDAFNGALAAAIAEGRPLAEAVQRAVAAGALATTHVGAREGMPTALELEEFLAAR